MFCQRLQNIDCMYFLLCTNYFLLYQRGMSTFYHLGYKLPCFISRIFIQQYYLSEG